MAEGSEAGASISLQWVLGASTSAGVKSIDSDTLLYLSGNVGVIYGISRKEQKLLRGHRNPVRACAMSPDHSLLATACAGPESALIIWTPQGDPVAMIAAPHPAGCAAVDISPDGRFVATLSVPFPAADGAGGAGDGGGQQQLQEVAVWALPSAAAQEEDAEGGAADASQPQCIARAPVPTPATQLSIAFRTALAPGEAERVASGASCAFELATTGPAAVVFWSLVRSCLLTRPGVDDDPAAIVSGLANAAEDGLATTVRPAEAPPRGQLLSGGSSALSAPAPDGRTGGGVWVEMWSLRGAPCHPPGLSGGSGGGGPPSTALSATGRGKTKTAVAAAPPRQCTVTVFLPPVNTGNAIVTCATALSDGQVLLWGSGSSSGGTAVTAVAPTPLPTPQSPGARGRGRGGSDGGSPGASDEDAAAAHSVAAEAMAAAREAAAVQALAASTLVKAVQKTVKLGKPTFLGGADAATQQGPDSAAAASPGINTLTLSPCERYIVAGGEDGAVRVYDLGLRLQAWFEDLDAGPVTGIGFVPSASAVAAVRRQQNRRGSFGTGGYSPQPPPGAATGPRGRRRSSLTMIERRLAGADAADVGVAGLADMVIATRHSLILTLQSSSFASGDETARRGVVVLEGPDAAVVGLVAYPAPPSAEEGGGRGFGGGGNRLAIATASGAVQSWDVDSRQLLLVRQLPRTLPRAIAVAQGLVSPAGGGGAAATGALGGLNPHEPVPVGAYHPTCLAIDPSGRFLAVGTAEGEVLILSSADLTDTQLPVVPPKSQLPADGCGGLAAAAAQAAITRLVFSPDGMHLAACDAGRRVLLLRYCRTRTTHISSRAPSRMSLTAFGGVPGSRAASQRLGGSRARGGAALTAAASVGAGVRPPSPTGSVRARKAWEVVEGDDSGVEELVADAWAFIGRARSHTAAVTGLAFAPLPPPEAIAPGSPAAGAPWRGGAEGLEAERFWSPDEGDGSTPAVAALLQRHAAWGLSVLASVGADRRAVLYDVGASSVTGGLSVLGNHRTTTEQWAAPTACVWLSGADTGGNVPASAAGAPHLLTASSHFKFKLWSVTPEPACRRTVLAPTFGGSVSQLVPMEPRRARGEGARGAAGSPDFTPRLRDPTASASATHSPQHQGGHSQLSRSGAGVTALAFATDDRVVGLVATPLDGNPYSFVGVVGERGAGR